MGTFGFVLRFWASQPSTEPSWPTQILSAFGLGRLGGTRDGLGATEGHPGQWKKLLRPSRSDVSEIKAVPIVHGFLRTFAGVETLLVRSRRLRVMGIPQVAGRSKRSHVVDFRWNTFDSIIILVPLGGTGLDRCSHGCLFASIEQVLATRSKRFA